MKIVLTDATTIEVTDIVPHAGGLIIDTTETSLAEIEQHITAENIDTITCMEGDTVFARYYNQQLDCISKDGRAHISKQSTKSCLQIKMCRNSWLICKIRFCQSAMISQACSQCRTCSSPQSLISAISYRRV